MPLPFGLDLQERHEGADLLLDGVESDQLVELGLEFRHRPGRLGPPELIRDPVGRVRGPGGLGQPLAENPEPAGHVFEWIGHAGIVPTRSWRGHSKQGFASSWRRVGPIR